MLSNAAGKATTHANARNLSKTQYQLASRRIWLPKLVYDALPYFYLVSGLAAFFATLYVSEWFWILPHYVLFSFVCLHLGVIVYRRRHSSSADDPH